MRGNFFLERKFVMKRVDNDGRLTLAQLSGQCYNNDVYKLHCWACFCAIPKHVCALCWFAYFGVSKFFY